MSLYGLADGGRLALAQGAAPGKEIPSWAHLCLPGVERVLAGPSHLLGSWVAGEDHSCCYLNCPHCHLECHSRPHGALSMWQAAQLWFLQGSVF